jgi:hypothetical protein
LRHKNQQGTFLISLIGRSDELYLMKDDCRLGKGHSVMNFIVSNPQVKPLHLFIQVYLMIPSIQSSYYLHEITIGENRVGSKCKEGERVREQWINGVRDGVLVRSGKGRVLEMAISEKGHLSIFSKASQ